MWCSEGDMLLVIVFMKITYNHGTVVNDIILSGKLYRFHREKNKNAENILDSYIKASIKFSIGACFKKQYSYSSVRDCFYNCPPSCKQVKRLLSKDCFDDIDEQTIFGRQTLRCLRFYIPYRPCFRGKCV